MVTTSEGCWELKWKNFVQCQALNKWLIKGSQNDAEPGGSDGKESACNAGDLGLIPGSGRSPGEENGNPLQYSCLENPHGQRILVGYSFHGVSKSQRRLGDFHSLTHSVLYSFPKSNITLWDYFPLVWKLSLSKSYSCILWRQSHQGLFVGKYFYFGLTFEVSFHLI